MPVQNRYVESEGPVDLAEWTIREMWTEGGRRRLWYSGREWWEWVEQVNGGRWVKRDQDYMRAKVYDALRGASVGGPDENETVEINKRVVDWVIDVLVGLVRWDAGEWPRWIGQAKTDRLFTVAFEDVCVDLKATAKAGQWVCVERDEGWFSPTVVPCKFDPEALCPEFDKCMKEWSNKDKEWEEASDRMYGYAMVAYRGYAKWLNEYGPVRSGKGTRSRMLRKMLGEEWVGGTLQDELAGAFGLEAVKDCKVLVVDECRRINEERAGRLATIVKGATGQSEMQVNIKGVKHKRMTLGHLVVAIGNDPLVMPNRNKGLSSKMVALKGEVSFLGKEKWGLDETLGEEMAGIALRWMKGMVRMVQEDGVVKNPKSGQETIEAFELDAAGSWGEAIGECFKAMPLWSVNADAVRDRLVKWQHENGVWLEDEQGNKVPSKRLLRVLERMSPWPLKVKKVWDPHADNTVWKVQGIALK
jgi:putative DNA primase/helicase